jgi:predicted RNase H-like nuclease (RuvC/YqgF family)
MVLFSYTLSEWDKRKAMNNNNNRRISSVSRLDFEHIVKRVVSLESRIDSLQSTISHVDKEYTSMRDSVIDYQVTVSRFSETADRMKSLETEIRCVRDKLIEYDARFKSIDDLKKLMAATLIAVLPGCATMFLELMKVVTPMISGHP